MKMLRLSFPLYLESRAGERILVVAQERLDPNLDGLDEELISCFQLETIREKFCQSIEASNSKRKHAVKVRPATHVIRVPISHTRRPKFNMQARHNRQ
jgi:hypothetical protein